jgi:hypothetical protein
MSCNVLLHDNSRHARTLLSHLNISMIKAYLAAVNVDGALVLNLSMGLRNARWVSVHEIDVRLNLG